MIFFIQNDGVIGQADYLQAVSFKIHRRAMILVLLHPTVKMPRIHSESLDPSNKLKRPPINQRPFQFIYVERAPSRQQTPPGLSDRSNQRRGIGA